MRETIIVRTKQSWLSASLIIGLMIGLLQSTTTVEQAA